MTINDIIFFLGLMICLSIIAYKFYNVLTLGEAYGMTMATMLFCGYFLGWIMVIASYIAVSHIATKNILQVMTFLTSWLIWLNVAFYVIEILFFIKRNLVTRERYQRLD